MSGNSWQNGTAEGAYGGTPAALPGTVQAANYDTGGQGVAYNVTSVNGTGNSYRSDGVDLEACTDTGCGDDLGWTAQGSGSGTPSTSPPPGPTRSASGSPPPSGVTGAFHLADTTGADLTGAENIPATGGWQTWATVTTPSISPPASTP